MSAGQIAALICAIILLFPGGCFLFFGVIGLPPLLLIAFIILGLAAWLFAFAFRRPSLAATGGAPPPVDLTSPLTAERARRELQLRHYDVRRFIFGSNRHDVRLPNGATRDFPDEAAFLEWARAELSGNAEESSQGG
jgi:hypothetical protein